MNSKLNIDCGFEVNSQQIESGLHQTNDFLETIPSNVYKNIDYKTTSSIVGSMFCQSIANATGAIVNPIEKGHPDIFLKPPKILQKKSCVTIQWVWKLSVPLEI